MFRVPAEYKYSKGITKNLLRKATVDIIPESTRKRIKKTGWNAPAHLWFSGEEGEKIKDIVASSDFRQMGIYKIKSVESLLDDHFKIVRENQIRENHMMLIWQLANLYTWIKQIR